MEDELSRCRDLLSAEPVAAPETEMLREVLLNALAVPQGHLVERPREYVADISRVGRPADLGLWIPRIPHERGGCAVRCAKWQLARLPGF